MCAQTSVPSGVLYVLKDMTYLFLNSSAGLVGLAVFLFTTLQLTNGASAALLTAARVLVLIISPPFLIFILLYIMDNLLLKHRTTQRVQKIIFFYFPCRRGRMMATRKLLPYFFS